MSDNVTGERAVAGNPAVATLALSMLLASLGTSIANIALPTLAEAFSASFHEVQWVVVSYLATLTVSVVLVGRIGDRFGLGMTYRIGLILFGLASLLCGLAPNLAFLVGARVLQGIGAAVLMTLAMALVRETVEDDRIGRAMGLLGTMSALGTALGPSLGGALLSAGSWRSIFLVLVPVALLTLILAYRGLPSAAGSRNVPSLSFRAMLGSGLMPSLLANLLVAAVMMTTLVVGPFYLGLGLGLTTAVIGVVMTVGPLISILTGVPSGRLVDHWGADRVVSLGLAALAAGAIALAVLPQFIGVAGYVTAIAILTPGYQLFQSANNTAVMAGVPGDRRGVVSGLLGLSRNLGLMAGASVMAAVFALGTGTDSIEAASPVAIGHGMQLTFLLAASLMAITLLIMRRKSGRNS